jgi:hypothetical protein
MVSIFLSVCLWESQVKQVANFGEMSLNNVMPQKKRFYFLHYSMHTVLCFFYIHLCIHTNT